MRLKVERVVVCALGMAALATGATARSWHITTANQEDRVCAETRSGAHSYTTMSGTQPSSNTSPSEADWVASGCAATRPPTRAEALRLLKEVSSRQTDPSRPLDFSRDILPQMRALAALNAANQAERDGQP